MNLRGRFMTGNMAPIPITEDERTPWYGIAAHFGWRVEDGRYAGKDREQANSDFNAPLRHLAAAWHRNPTKTATALEPVFAAAEPTPETLRSGRNKRWKDQIRVTVEEIAALDEVASHFGIFYGRRPFPMEAIRRIGRLFERDAQGEELVIAALTEVYRLLPKRYRRLGLKTFVRLGLNDGDEVQADSESAPEVEDTEAALPGS